MNFLQNILWSFLNTQFVKKHHAKPIMEYPLPNVLEHPLSVAYGIFCGDKLSFKMPNYK